MISAEPYLFTRTYSRDDYSDQVLVGLELVGGELTLKVGDFFNEGSILYDYYSGNTVKVENGEVRLDSEFNIVLLAKK